MLCEGKFFGFGTIAGWVVQDQDCKRVFRKLVEVLSIKPRLLHFFYVGVDEEMQVVKVVPQLNRFVGEERGELKGTGGIGE